MPGVSCPQLCPKGPGNRSDPRICVPEQPPFGLQLLLEGSNATAALCCRARLTAALASATSSPAVSGTIATRTPSSTPCPRLFEARRMLIFPLFPVLLVCPALVSRSSTPRSSTRTITARAHSRHPTAPSDHPAVPFVDHRREDRRLQAMTAAHAVKAPGREVVALVSIDETGVLSSI